MMKIRFYLLCACLLAGLPILSAQVIETIRPPVVRDGNVYRNEKKSQLQKATPRASVDPKLIARQLKWDITLQQHGRDHGNSVAPEVMDSLRLSGTMYPDLAEMLHHVEDTGSTNRNTVGAPVISGGMKGNAYNTWAPPDNNIAVSDEGHIVSVINSSILMANVNGEVLREENLSDFFSVLNLPGVYFDPKVLYDPIEDKFILVVLNGNTPATSTVVVAFSTTSDPNQNWWFYSFPGDPLGSNMWFDYPSIGISEHDLYISGNLFTPEGQFGQVIIYQIGKAPGFIGGSVNHLFWYDIRDDHDVLDYTVVPVSFGFDGAVSPGIYMVSTDDTGGSEVTMYYMDNDVDHNPNLEVYSSAMTKYYPPFTGLMQGTTDKIKTNDTRILSGFYADGTIHFAFNTRGDVFHTLVYYCRLNTADLTNHYLTFGLQPFEYAFPSIAPFTTSVTDKSVLIGFLRTSGSIYPEFRVATVDHDMNYSGSVLVKEGESFVDHDAGTTERWGDYTGISRRHTANGIEVWVSGSFGEDLDNGYANRLGTWIARVTDGQGGAAPIAGFTSDITSVTSGGTVHFQDISTYAPTAWQWSFPGGTPNASNQQHPVVTYPQPGCYDVTLTASNAVGNDVLTKTCYIDVLTSITELNNVFSRFSVFPNPVSTGRLNVEFEMNEAAELDFYVIDERGTFNKNLLHRRVKAGLNHLAFNTDLLATGLYHLLVYDEHHALMKHVKFTVIR